MGGAGGMIGGGTNMVSGIAGDNISQMSQIEGAELKAEIQRQSLAFQNKVFNDQVKRLKPYWKEGKKALEKLESLDETRGDLTMDTWGTEQAYSESQEALGDMDIREQAQNRLRTKTSLSGKQRQRAISQDMVDVGMGAAGTAGRLTPDQGPQQMKIGYEQAMATQRYQTGMQNALMRGMDRASGIPAYARYGQSNQQAPEGRYYPNSSRRYSGGF